MQEPHEAVLGALLPSYAPLAFQDLRFIRRVLYRYISVVHAQSCLYLLLSIFVRTLYPSQSMISR